MITLWLTHWRSAFITAFLVKSSMAASLRSGPSLPTVRLNSARYTLRGACYYEPLGRFPRMSIKDARECARELYNRFDDNRVPDEEYGAIPF